MPPTAAHPWTAALAVLALVLTASSAANAGDATPAPAAGDAAAAESASAPLVVLYNRIAPPLSRRDPPGKLVWIDPDTLAVRGAVDVPPWPRQLAVDRARRIAAVACAGPFKGGLFHTWHPLGPGRLAIVDLAAARVIATLETGFYPTDLRLSEDGSRAVVATREKTGPPRLHVVDIARAQLVGTVEIGADEPTFALSADGRRLWLVDAGTRSPATGLTVPETPARPAALRVLATDDLRPLLELPLEKPLLPDLSATGEPSLAVSPGDGRLFRFGGTPPRVIETVDLGQRNVQVTHDAASGRLYSVGERAGGAGWDVAVVGPSGIEARVPLPGGAVTGIVLSDDRARLIVRREGGTDVVDLGERRVAASHGDELLLLADGGAGRLVGVAPKKNAVHVLGVPAGGSTVLPVKIARPEPYEMGPLVGAVEFAVFPAHDLVLVIDSRSRLVVIDTARGEILDRIPLGAGPVGIVPVPERDEAWLLGNGTPFALGRFDLRTRKGKEFEKAWAGQRMPAVDLDGGLTWLVGWRIEVADPQGLRFVDDKRLRAHQEVIAIALPGKGRVHDRERRWSGWNP